MQSSLSKIIIVLIAIVVILGAGGLWYFLHLNSSTQTNTQIQSNGLPNVPQSNGNNSSSGTNAQPNKAHALSAIEQAYVYLLQTLSAQKITYTEATLNSTTALASLYNLYSADVAESKKLYPTQTDFSIEVGMADLNGNGTQEAFVYENLPGFCGSGGCALDIYSGSQGKWTKILSIVGGEEVGIANTATNGYSDLYLSPANDNGSQTNVVRYAWDGTKYQPEETVATWDGSSFVLSQ